MLSHLRFHRRGASTPSSPVPEHPPSFSSVSTNESPQPLENASPLDGASSSAAPVHPPPPPPAARDVSSESNPRCERRNTAGLVPEGRPQQAQRLSYNGDSGFIGGAALQNYRRDVEAQQAPTKVDTVDRANNNQFEDKSQNQHHHNKDAATDSLPNVQLTKLMSFSKPADLPVSPSFNLGRRPTGARLPPESPVLTSNPPSAANVETQRSKKGLPFLKNPMSTLLMRRRNNQPAPDLRPLPLKKKDEEPAYDPRIKGTRIHDFSAPRKSRETHVNKYSAPAPHVISNTSPRTGQETTPASSCHVRKNISSKDQIDVAQSPNVSLMNQSSKPVENASRTTSRSSSNPANDQEHGLDAGIATVFSPSKDDDGALPRRDVSVEASREHMEARTGLSSSVRTARSRSIALPEMSTSAIPKHMKSTSSRFSFDMTGAAKQEKLLEERHRQRELERKTTGGDGNIDSRFDEFDEDTFDYDAMMDDDGLEERIPGVNADFEDDDVSCSGVLDSEADPDNDQENFAGFVFQRSNPVSSSASPLSSGMMLTPRDADGNAIGFAVSKEPPGASTFPIPGPPFGFHKMNDHEQDASLLSAHEAATNSLSQQLGNEDDLYYDDGMIGLEEYDICGDNVVPLESDGQPFDESIFDENDTDQFGRPVPGAFQQAQSLRRAAQQTGSKPFSDARACMPHPSAISRNVTRTSLDADGGMHESHHAPHDETGDQSQPQDSRALNGGSGSVAAYQAALAAAACRAAATGKFHRSSSPSSASLHTEDDPASTVDGDDVLDDGEEVHGYVDEVGDDFDFDDDAIIAEANASALANDSDGWYGQEFGFYSAPPNAYASSHAAGTCSPKDYEYANGGFFGPGGTLGPNQSTNGRLISREPNLTPITERSEYSNRNSFMSLGYPPINTSTPVVQSPGLAQLAMMTDARDDQMTLSALLRLRSKAWGGSQASLSSSREGSPRSERGDATTSSWLLNPHGVVGSQTNHSHSWKPSTCLAVSCDDESDDGASASASPTMTLATADAGHLQKLSSATEEDTTQALAEDGGTESHEHGSEPHPPAEDICFDDANEFSSIQSRMKKSPGTTHDNDEESVRLCRNKAVGGHHDRISADSVCYIKEEDSGETRWVLERRRTAESGEIEVLDREVIEGRKI